MDASNNGRIFNKIDLIRLENDSQRIFGIFRWQKVIVGCSLERADKHVSPGMYYLHLYDSPSMRDKLNIDHFWVWELREHPSNSTACNMTHIQIHIGNWLKDTDGCILIGSKFDEIKGKSMSKPERGVFGSGKAFNNLMKLTSSQFGMFLNVMEVY